MTIPPTQVAAIAADALGVQLPWEFGRREQSVLLSIRLPRACLGILTGAVLAVAGAALQGLFRNPLADPALIGVSTGAALAAVGVIVLGATLNAAIVSALGPFLLPLAAFAGGLATTLVVYRIASRDGRTDVATMLLAGVALNAIASAGIGLLVFVSTDQQLRDLNFWLLGSLGGNTWRGMIPAIPFIAVAVAMLPMLARHLNAFLLGESDALHLGFHVERTKRAIVVLAALGTGASVALTGVIGFVGLVVPHLVRLSIGPDHRYLLPASAPAGRRVDADRRSRRAQRRVAGGVADRDSHLLRRRALLPVAVAPAPFAAGLVMLEARDIRLDIGGTTILRGVSLAVASGEVVAVLGPNGAGKSTLLGVLSGAVAPSSGLAVLDGQHLAAWKPQELARRRAVLPQHFELGFSFRVLEVGACRAIPPYGVQQPRPRPCDRHRGSDRDRGGPSRQPRLLDPVGWREAARPVRPHPGPGRLCRYGGRFSGALPAA